MEDIFYNLEMNLVHVSINDAKEMKQNPYLEHLNVNERVTLKRFKRNEAVITEKIKDYDIVQELTNQNRKLTEVDLGIGKIKRKTTSPFVIIYTDQVIDYMGLSPLCLKVLFYIFYERIDLGKDYIIINPRELVEKLKISKNSAYGIFVELLNNNIIRKRNDYTWWINPNYFFSGNRTKIYSK